MRVQAGEEILLLEKARLPPSIRQNLCRPGHREEGFGAKQCPLGGECAQLTPALLIE
jgi:hypothetical protein